MRHLQVAVWGLLGVFARYYAGLFAARYLPPPFPYGTFAINIVGAFLIGFVYVLGAERNLLSADLRIGILVGFLGGFTTFSSYCLETTRLWEAGESGLALLYFLSSPVLGLAAAFAGLLVARYVFVGGA